MKRLITETTPNKDINILSYLQPCISFLIENRSRIKLSNIDNAKIITDSTRISNTLISNIYENILRETKLEMFSMLYLKDMTNIPFALTIPWFIMDTKLFSDDRVIKSLNAIPEYKDKILLDITPYVTVAKNAPIRITDILAFQSNIVRAVLNRSYHAFSDMWLSSIIVFYLAKIYGTVMSSKIARLYNLNYQEQMTITTVFMIFMIYSCSDSIEPSDVLLSKLPALNSTVDVKSIVAAVRSYYNENKVFDVVGAISVIREISPARLADFEYRHFVEMNISLTSDHIISWMSIEYPPFFLASLIDAVSGVKTSLYHDIKNTGLKKDAAVLGTELYRSKSIVKLI